MTSAPSVTLDCHIYINYYIGEQFSNLTHTAPDQDEAFHMDKGMNELSSLLYQYTPMLISVV